MSKSRATFVMLAGLCLAAGGLAVPVAAQPAPQHLLPQGIQVEHKETLEQLQSIAATRGPVGAAAAKVLALMKRHMAKEQEYILPPLTLLPQLADGQVTPDMAWALPMIDRVKAEREQLFQEHADVTDALNALVVAATAAHDRVAKAFAETAAADSLTDLEILEPTILLIGDVLRSKLPADRQGGAGK